MSGTTISGTSSIGITLDSSDTNPVSVTGTITVASGNALYGLGGPSDGGDGPLYGWTIDNSGTIGSTGGFALALGLGNYYVAQSAVTNRAGGVMSGAVGVYIRGPGSVTNISGGSITGTGDSAVLIGVGLGTIVNGGALLGGTFGIDEQQGGSVNNLGSGVPKGTITGTVAGIHVAGAAGTVNNAGLISGGSYGTDEIVGGSITNQAGGSITGTGRIGVYIHGGVGTVVNSGVVQGGQFGVRELGGGSVSNLSGGIITGAESGGVYITGGSGAVYNTATITSGYVGVALGDGGSVTNQSGSITGSGYGVAISGGTGTVINTGSVYGGNSGVTLADGGSVTNNPGGIITAGTFDAINITGSLGTIVNAGSALGERYGAYLGGGGTITNQPNRTISGSTGILLSNAPGTVTNAGMISGSNNAIVLFGGSTLTNSGTIHAGSMGNDAVQFSTGSNSKLIVDPGAVFYGVITGGGGEIDLAGTSAGTLAGFDGISITNFASLQFETGADWTISGDSSADGLSGISNIGGFNTTDTIDLTGFVATSVAFASNQLVLTAAGDATDTLNITGGFQTSNFLYGTDGGSGTDITFTATCYAAGTRIRTTRGELAVENLREGDLVLTVSGRTQPISWIGHRHVNFHGHPNRQRILPVRITAHAFGQGTPERDLLLSPDHAVFVEDVLIPIRHLVNGGSIAQIECDAITYYHIELPRHDVLLADGMPAESYLEAGARDAFANVDGVIQLYPDFEPPRDHYAMLWEAEAYAPLVVAGEQLDRARCKLADRAAWPPFGEGVAALPSSPLSANQCLGLPA